MKLVEALEILKKEQPQEAAAFRAFLVCGFSPMHLQTFLEAQFRLTLPSRKTEILSGLYDDFWGNLNRVETSGVDAGIVVLEWSDLDPRLGLRSLGSWEPATLPEILGNVRAKTTHLAGTIARLSRQTALVISFPTLPLPPISYSPGWQAGSFDLELRALLSSAGAQLGGMPNVKVVNAVRLDHLSAPASRLDAKSEIASGFPYKLAHASLMAELMSRMALPAMPKKGLITDLDDTLWSGILGEVGAERIYWDLEHN
ncbi:MAG TPA: HAD family hydrolase, partial [Candidatus Angelobacter sp.]|nr:HAD family hydrolase [Candidatus Angelobacter sp.]